MNAITKIMGAVSTSRSRNASNNRGKENFLVLVAITGKGKKENTSAFCVRGQGFHGK
jgi:hypothetical protein